MSTPRRSQFSGSLIGQSLGDALGFPVEGYVADVCRQYVAGVIRAGRAGKVGRSPYPFGQYTDDTQLARELLLSYLNCGGFNAADYASRIAALFAENRVVGRGRATEEAAQRLISGVAWEEAGTPPPAAGNGGAMRAGPVGLLFYDDAEGLVRAADDQARITHRDSRSCGGAVAVAGAVSLALRGEVEREHFLASLAEWTEGVDATMSASLRQLQEWMDLPPAEAVVLIGGAAQETPPQKQWRGITPYVVGSVLWSLYAFLRYPDDYLETICLAISCGGDVDTTAAMAGAVSGAYLGLETLPSDLCRKITDRGSWGYVELLSLAEQCHALKTGTG